MLKNYIKCSKVFCFFIIVFIVTSCAENKSQEIQDNALMLSNPPYKCFKQKKKNITHPNEYYTCVKCY